MRLTTCTSMTTLALAVGMMLAAGCSSTDETTNAAGAGGSAAGTSSAGGSSAGTGTTGGAGGTETAGTNSGGSSAGTSSGGTSSAGTSSGGTSSAGTNSGGTSAGTNSGGTNAGGTGTKGQWVEIPLLDETVDGKTYEHSKDDWVNGLWFDASGKGFIGTYLGGVEDWGGTLTAVENNKAQKIILNGGHQWLDPDINVNFRTVHKVKSGWAVQIERIGLVYLSTDGQNFTRTKPGIGFENLANASYGWFEDSTGGWWTGDNIGNLYHATSAPAPTTAWTKVTPPESACSAPQTNQSGGGGYQWRRLFVSDDGQTIAYPLGDSIGVCVTVDGGKTWGSKALPNPPKGAEKPFGLVYTSATHGIVYGRDTGADGSAYVYYTDDGGLTWNPSTIPAFNGEDATQFRDLAFAPGGKVGYFVGGKFGSSTDEPPLLYKTTDGGKTWLDITTASFTGSPLDPNGGPVLATVFAASDDELWIGGYEGLLLHHNKGGISD